MLTYKQRKGRLPFGAGTRVREVTDLPPSTLTQILKGKMRNRVAEELFAGLMVPATTVDEAFGPPGVESLRRPPRRQRRAMPRLASAARATNGKETH